MNVEKKSDSVPPVYYLSAGRSATVPAAPGVTFIPNWTFGLVDEGMSFEASGLYVTLLDCLAQGKVFCSSAQLASRETSETVTAIMHELNEVGLIDLSEDQVLLHTAPDPGNKMHLRAQKSIQALHSEGSL